MLFCIFGFGEERRAFGGPAFIELQSCRLPQGTKERQIPSEDAVRHWAEDFLYGFGDEIGELLLILRPIIAGGADANWNAACSIALESGSIVSDRRRKSWRALHGQSRLNIKRS